MSGDTGRGASDAEVHEWNGSHDRKTCAHRRTHRGATDRHCTDKSTNTHKTTRTLTQKVGRHALEAIDSSQGSMRTQQTAGSVCVCLWSAAGWWLHGRGCTRVCGWMDGWMGMQMSVCLSVSLSLYATCMYAWCVDTDGCDMDPDQLQSSEWCTYITCQLALSPHHISL